jgi:hypothetical protein
MGLWTIKKIDRNWKVLQEILPIQCKSARVGEACEIELATLQSGITISIASASMAGNLWTVAKTETLFKRMDRWRPACEPPRLRALPDSRIADGARGNQPIPDE